MTRAMVKVPGIIISLKYLVYIEEACSDACHGEILLEGVLVHSILLLLKLGHVVAVVPGVDLTIILKTMLLTLMVENKNLHCVQIENIWTIL